MTHTAFDDQFVAEPEGEAMIFDPTRNRIRTDRLHPDNLAVMKSWKHGWEREDSDFRWVDDANPLWLDECCYRAKRQTTESITELAALRAERDELAEENTKLREQNDHLLNTTKIHISDDVARAALGEAMQQITALRASEAAAQVQLATLRAYITVPADHLAGDPQAADYDQDAEEAYTDSLTDGAAE